MFRSRLSDVLSNYSKGSEGKWMQMAHYVILSPEVHSAQESIIDPGERDRAAGLGTFMR